MRSGMKNLSAIVKYVLTTPWWPANKLEWYKAIIWSTHTSVMANTAFSFSKFNLNSNESNNIYLSTNISILCIALCELGNLFWQRYRYRSLKYGLFKYPAWISFNSNWKVSSLQYFSLDNFQNLVYICLFWYIFLNYLVCIN